MKVSLLSILMLFFISCSSNLEVETVSLEDILPKSSYPTSDQEIEDTGDSTSISSFKSDLLKAIQDSALHFSETPYSVKLFPDRLRHVVRHQELFVLDSDSIALTAWQFSDSLTTINAFYNWLDCFGDNCSEIQIGEEVKFSKNSVLTLVSNFHLVHITSSKSFDIIKWQNEIVPSLFPDEFWIYALSQPAKKKAKWHIYVQ